MGGHICQDEKIQVLTFFFFFFFDFCQDGDFLIKTYKNGNFLVKGYQNDFFVKILVKIYLPELISISVIYAKMKKIQILTFFFFLTLAKMVIFSSKLTKMK